MKLSQSIKPISYLKQNTAEAIKDVSEHLSPMVITQNGEAKAVLMDITEYEQIQDTLALLKMVAQSKNDYQEGNHKSAKKTFSDLRKQIKNN